MSTSTASTSSRCGSRTLFSNLVVGRVNLLGDPCSIQLTVGPDPDHWYTGNGIHAPNLNITNVELFNLSDDVSWIRLDYNQITTFPVVNANHLAAFGIVNNRIDHLINVTLPESLAVLCLQNNPLVRVYGVHFPANLQDLHMNTTIQVFEIAERDIATFDGFDGDFNPYVTQTSCQNPKAKLQAIKGKNLCVLPDKEWDALYGRPVAWQENSTSPSKPLDGKASAASSNNRSSVTVWIAIGAAAAVVVVVAAFILMRKRREPKDPDRTTGYSKTNSSSNNPSDDTANLWNDPIFAASRISLDLIQEEQRIGQGAFGEVYKGTCNGRIVAIKKLKENFRKDHKHLLRFMNEVKLMASMEHPNLVEFIGIAGETLTKLCVVLEFMDRGDLASLIKSYKQIGRPTGFNRERLLIAFHIANGLTYLHSLDPPILHRDLKSHNVLLNEQMEAKLTDFGISRECIEQTMTAGIGTSRWMAPEVMQSGHYNEKADIFSFGVVLSELDTLETPYARFSVDGSGRKMPETALLQKVAMGQLTVHFTEQKMEEMVALARQCIALDPEERPTAAEISYKLQQLLKTCVDE